MNYLRALVRRLRLVALVFESSSHQLYKGYRWGINNDDAMSNDCAMEHREADKTINNNYLEFF